MKINACPNDCCLFRGKFEMAEKCSKCGASRWKVNKRTNRVQKGVPMKILLYFSPISRFRRMLKSPDLVKDLTWHYTHRSQDGKMRHPVDTLAWELIDNTWPSFSLEPRNLRLELAADGVNPFSNVSARYSC